jgi:hypothetical protein
MQQLIELRRFDAQHSLFSSMSPSCTISTAIFTAAPAVRLPLRVCSM